MSRLQVTLDDLPRVLVRDTKARARRIDGALTKTAKAGVKIVVPHVPVAFDELRDSVHADGHQIIANAPHAAAVENGSRPHFPPLEPLIRWVKLRGMQALYGLKGQRTGRAHSFEVAQRIGAMLRNEESSTSPKYKRRGKFSDVDAPTRIARAIQQSIGHRGTRPYFYMGGSLPEIMSALDGFVRAALPDAAGDVSAPTSAGGAATADG